MKFEWSEKYSVHVLALDDQHKHYFSILNDITQKLEQGTIDKEEIRVMLSDLFDYAAYHLGTEEDLFVEHAYPDMAPHIAQHDYYRQTVAYFMNSLDEQEDLNAFVAKVVEFAAEWFASHILVEDQKYSRFMNEHGVI